MGNLLKRKKTEKETKLEKYKFIPDKYSNYQDLHHGLRQAGVEACNLIFAIDYTESNKRSGLHTFYNKNLHTIDSTCKNPYEYVIELVGCTLEDFDVDKKIPAFGFGDSVTKATKIFNINPFGIECNTFKEVLQFYKSITPHVDLMGPTSFVPIISHAIDIVKREGSYHILIIVTDGAVCDVEQTKKIICDASKHPLSIVGIGVGDGPFDVMEELDDHLPQRDFDNFNFVNMNKVLTEAQVKGINAEVLFLISALQEIPDQYNYLKEVNKLNLQPCPEQFYTKVVPTHPAYLKMQQAQL